MGWWKSDAGKRARVSHRKKYRNTEKGKVTEKIYRAKFIRSTSGRFNSGKNSAKKRQLEWTISKEEYSNILINSNMLCHYCGNSLNETGSGLDRINTLEGYHLNNVVTCCNSCNKLKSNVLSYEEFKVVIKALLDYRSKNS